MTLIYEWSCQRSLQIPANAHPNAMPNPIALFNAARGPRTDNAASPASRIALYPDFSRASASFRPPHLLPVNESSRRNECTTLIRGSCSYSSSSVWLVRRLLHYHHWCVRCSLHLCRGRRCRSPSRRSRVRHSSPLTSIPCTLRPSSRRRRDLVAA